MVNVWAVRNVAVFHRLVLVKSNLAYDFYKGNFGPHAGVYDGDYLGRHPVWNTAADPNAPYRVLGEMGFIDSYREKIRAALIDRPDWSSIKVRCCTPPRSSTTLTGLNAKARIRCLPPWFIRSLRWASCCCCRFVVARVRCFRMPFCWQSPCTSRRTSWLRSTPAICSR